MVLPDRDIAKSQHAIPPEQDWANSELVQSLQLQVEDLAASVQHLGELRTRHRGDLGFTDHH